jgi:hypothetical protein
MGEFAFILFLTAFIAELAAFMAENVTSYR